VVRRIGGGSASEVVRAYGRCPARTGHLLYCGLSLNPLGERSSAESCRALLRFAASNALPARPERQRPLALQLRQRPWQSVLKLQGLRRAA
jgi:hypothetical protein